MRKWLTTLFFVRLGILNWRHNRSQSTVFGVSILYPTGSEIWRFWHIKTRGRKIAIEKYFLLHLSAHWGDLIEQIKKICHIHFKSDNHVVFKVNTYWDWEWKVFELCLEIFGTCLISVYLWIWWNLHQNSKPSEDKNVMPLIQNSYNLVKRWVIPGSN